MRAKREEEERKRQEELRRQQEEILRRQQEEERKRREEEELARRKQVTLSRTTVTTGLVPKEGLQGSSLTPIISQAVVHRDGLSKVNNRTGSLEDSLPFRVSCPLTPTGGIVLSPSKTLEFISFAYFLGFYKPVRYQK